MLSRRTCEALAEAYPDIIGTHLVRVGEVAFVCKFTEFYERDVPMKNWGDAAWERKVVYPAEEERQTPMLVLPRMGHLLGQAGLWQPRAEELLAIAFPLAVQPPARGRLEMHNGGYAFGVTDPDYEGFSGPCGRGPGPEDAVAAWLLIRAGVVLRDG